MEKMKVIYPVPAELSERNVAEKIKVIYPIPAELGEGNDTYGSRQFIMKMVAAALCGATIPAIIFYFLM